MLPSSRPLPKNPSIPASFLGLSRAVAEHLLALFSLASLEAQELFKKTLSSLVLLIATIVALLMAYLSLLATVSMTAVTYFHYGWIPVLTILTLAHFLVAVTLILLLRQQCATSLPFEKTTAEIQCDLEALASNTPSDANTF
ncbi:MAG: phage holin family protein [Chthoniobacterales bacterium]